MHFWQRNICHTILCVKFLFFNSQKTSFTTNKYMQYALFRMWHKCLWKNSWNKFIFDFHMKIFSQLKMQSTVHVYTCSFVPPSWKMLHIEALPWSQYSTCMYVPLFSKPCRKTLLVQWCEPGPTPGNTHSHRTFPRTHSSESRIHTFHYYYTYRCYTLTT